MKDNYTKESYETQQQELIDQLKLQPDALSQKLLNFIQNSKWSGDETTFTGLMVRFRPRLYAPSTDIIYFNTIEDMLSKLSEQHKGQVHLMGNAVFDDVLYWDPCYRVVKYSSEEVYIPIGFCNQFISVNNSSMRRWC